MTQVQFLFDFGSPNAYLSHKVVPGIEARTGATFKYQPILLGGLFRLANNRSPGVAYADIPHKLAYEQLELKRFIERHGIADFKRNPHFPVNTLLIMRGAVAAQKLGCFKAYVDVVFAAMWERGCNMADPAVVAAELRSAGIDDAALLAAAQDMDVKQALTDKTNEAYQQGAFGAPTFFIGDEMYFGKDRLRDVEEAICRLRGKAALDEPGRHR